MKGCLYSCYKASSENYSDFLTFLAELAKLRAWNHPKSLRKALILKNGPPWKNRNFQLWINVKERIMSMSIVLVDQIFIANYFDIMLFEPCLLQTTLPGMLDGKKEIWPESCIVFSENTKLRIRVFYFTQFFRQTWFHSMNESCLNFCKAHAMRDIHTSNLPHTKSADVVLLLSIDKIKLPNS